MRSSGHVTRSGGVLAWLIPCALGVLVVVLAAQHSPRQGPVYSVAALDRLVRSDPTHWLNRTVRGRAIAQWCLAEIHALQAGETECMKEPPMLIDASTVLSPALPLVQGSMPGTAPLLPSLLHRLPLLGGLWPRPQPPRWEQVAVYRMRLVRIPRTSAPCLGCPSYAAARIGMPL